MDNQVEKSPVRFLILTPVFNDWTSLKLLLGDLDKVLSENNIKAKVVAVDDASSVQIDDSDFSSQPLKAITEISILELTRNLGHQRAIALGLTYINFEIDCDAVIVMDADGEDNPKDVLRLIEKCSETNFTKIVFARRAKRSEGNVFRLFYSIYKLIYSILAGDQIRVGNFSVVPFAILPRLVCVSEIWNHYSVGVRRARIPSVEILTNRSKRLSGKSQMNFVSLVTHGLSAISVYGDIVGVRLLIAAFVLIVASVAGIMATIVVRVTTEFAIPGWATNLTAILFVIALQASALCVFFVFIILSARNNFSFIPSRDYLPFIFRFRTVFSKL